MIKLTQRFRDIFGNEHNMIERVSDMKFVPETKKRLQNAVLSEHGVLLGSVKMEND